MSERNLSTALASHFNFYDLASVGYVSLNEQGLVLATNLTAAALMGIPRDDLVKQPISRFIFPEDQNIYSQHAGQLLETGIPQVYDLRMRKMDGTQFWAHLVAASAHNDDGSPMCHLVVSDITEHKRMAEELLESRANFAAFMEHLPGFAYMKDGQGRHTFVNKALEQHFGVGREGWLGKTFEQLVPLPGAEKIRVVDEAVLASKCPRIEEETTIESGQKHTYLSSKFPILQTDGSLALGGISLDITERKQAEEALSRTLSKTELILSAAGDGIYGVDLDGRVTFINPKAALLLGYAQDELLGQVAHAVTHHTRADGTPCPVEDCPIYAAFRDGMSHAVSDEIFWRKDDTSFPVDYTSAPVLDGDNRPIGAVVVFRDSSERKRVEEALGEREERLRAFLDNSSVIAWLKDEQGRYVYLSENYQRRFGVLLQDWTGKTDFDLWPRDMAEVFRRDDLAVLASDQPLELVGETRQRDGSLAWWLKSLFCLRDSTGNKYVGGLGVDITARKQAEEAQRLAATQLAEKIEELQRTQATLIETERLQAMGQMAVGVAHDFNNALMKVLGQAQLMRLTLERGPVAAALQGVAGGTRLLECLARQEQAAEEAAETVRKIGRTTRPRDTEVFEPVSLGEIVEQVLAITQPRWKDQAEAAGVRMTVQAALAETPPVLGHAAELREALTNLIFNALDAMPQGGTLTITTRQVSGSEVDETRAFDPVAERVREWVELSVADTGIGMPPAVQARLFEPFFTTKGVRGTGLGLSMVHGIISRHEGEVTVQSAAGQGTTITLRLPVAEAATEVVPPPTAPLPLPAPLKLLVIDDDPLLVETLHDLLRILGHEAAIATSGEEGLMRLAVERFDLVLTDLGMPGMSGWEVAQAVKARWPQLPVILVTGWGDALERARLEGSGVDVVLTKPYTVAQLTHALVQGVALIQQGGATDPEPDRLPPSNV